VDYLFLSRITSRIEYLDGSTLKNESSEDSLSFA